MYRSIPVVWVSEEDVIQPKCGIHSYNLDPVFAYVRAYIKQEKEAYYVHKVHMHGCEKSFNNIIILRIHTLRCYLVSH